MSEPTWVHRIEHTWLSESMASCGAHQSRRQKAKGGADTHDPILQGFQCVLLLGRELTQVIVHTAVVVSVVANYICQSGGGFFREP
jgi:hypothetical protein